jgi:hypothetical protein
MNKYNESQEISYFRANTTKFEPPIKEVMDLPFSNKFINQMNEAMSINIEEEINEKKEQTFNILNNKTFNKDNKNNIIKNKDDDFLSCFRIDTEKFEPPIKEVYEKSNNNFIEKMEEAMMTLNIDDTLFENNDYGSFINNNNLNDNNILINNKVYQIKYTIKDKNIIINLNLNFNNNNILNN